MKLLKKLIIIFISILLILTFILMPLVHAQTPLEKTLTIEGRLVNATPGGTVEAGIPLMLHSFDDRQMAAMVNGVTDAEGAFRFEQVEVAEGRTFEVMATVGQTVYFSERFAPSPGQATLELPVTIYDTTTDAGAIRVEQMHTLVDFFSPSLLQIAEIYILSNGGNLTVEEAVTLAGGQTATLRFTLPDGATDLSFEGGQLGQRFVQTGDGFADKSGVPPGSGTSQIVVRYFLPYQSGLRLSRSLAYPIDKLNVIVPQMGISLASDDLVWASSRQIQDERTVDIFTGAGIRAGQSFSFELTGQPEMNVVSVSPEFSTQQPAAQPTIAPKSLFIGLGLVGLGLVLLGGGVWWWRRERAKPALATSAESPETDLIWAIAELDEAYEAGEISKESYIHRRSTLRAELKALLSNNHQIESSKTVHLDKQEVEEAAVGTEAESF